MQTRKQARQKGVILVFVVIILLAIFAMMALAVDLGFYYNVRRDLQSMLDAAALAAAAALTENVEDPIQLARERAIEYAAKNSVMGQGSDPIEDWGLAIEFGDWDYDTQQFIVSEDRPIAIKLTAQLTEAGGNPVQTFFAKIVGIDSLDTAVSATAIYGSRDIIVTLDYSGSMSDDSKLQNIEILGQSEIEGYLQDIWEALKTADADRLGEIATSQMNLASTRITTSDENTILETLGLMQTTEAEVWVEGHYEGRGWRRVWVPGYYETQIVQQPIPYPYPPDDWDDYFDYVRSSNRNYGGTWSWWSGWDYEYEYQYEYGYLTWMDYLQSQQYIYAENDVPLYETPQQPITAVKDAVSVFLAYMREQPTDDRVGLASYTYTNGRGKLEVPLTEIDEDGNWPAIENTSRQRHAGYYDPYTNIAGGMEAGLDELTQNGRQGALRLLVLLSDGQANYNYDPYYGAYYDLNDAWNNAIAKAQFARDEHIPIVTISLGTNADTELMQQIADITGGIHFEIPGGDDVEDYEDQLKQVFAQIAGHLPLKLVD